MSETGMEQKYIKEAFDTNWVVPLGPNVNGFEKDLETFVGEDKHVVALSSGTAAVHLALLACGVGPGDEVIVQSFTFCASSHPITYLGATPIFIDSETETWNMDPILLEKAIQDRIEKTGKKPKAIVPVYLYGMPERIDEIMEIANRYDIPVIEDAAEGFGSRYHGQVVGTFGQYGVLSFNGNKMITTSGGGALICPDQEAKDRIMWYATQAREAYPYYQHEAIGYNYRMSNICAGIGYGYLPRTIAAALLGGALALSGYLLQTFFQNPIAGPFVLGISSGAKLAVALTLVGILQMGLRSSSFLLIAAAFVGALFSMGFVLLFARKVYQSAMLIVSGVMIGYICSAVTDFVVTFADDSNIVNLHNWSLGSFSGITWDNVKVIAVLVLITFICIIFLSKPIAACQLGEAYAASIGVNLRLFRTALVFLASLLAAAVTAFAGPISFVGIAVPQLIRSMFRTTKPLIMIPACFLGGAVFCLFSDLIARTVFAPVELSISSVTALFGAPVVIWVMMHRRKTG